MRLKTLLGFAVLAAAVSLMVMPPTQAKAAGFYTHDGWDDGHSCVQPIAAKAPAFVWVSAEPRMDDPPGTLAWMGRDEVTPMFTIWEFEGGGLLWTYIKVV